MENYIFKTYISAGREYFIYGDNIAALTKKDFPFLESLLGLLYLDIWEYEPLIRDMAGLIREIYQEPDFLHIDRLRSELDQLAQAHIFFQETRLEWLHHLELIGTSGNEELTDLLPVKELTHIPSTIDDMQKQIKCIFESVLDIDKGSDSTQKRMTAFLRHEKANTRRTFSFSALPLRFEVTGHDTFGEVLYPKDVYDLIEFSLREAIRREQRMRICKNCGRYFAIARRSSAEYCERPIDEKGRTCKDMGSIIQWTKNRADDDVFKVYRREYKRRFAWIKAGRITAGEFYAWSEKAREKKTMCDDGIISLEEYQQWLKDS